MIPYYVGFPRSGSHWIRIVLEEYTDGKSPISNFLDAKNETVQQMYSRARRGEFKGTHDMELTFDHPYVIYLYRNPIDCIFSHMKYEKINLNNKKKLDKFLNIWIAHIYKWHFREQFTKKKVIICYENLVKNFVEEFEKIVQFLNLPIYKNKIIISNNKCTKAKIKQIVHDKKVINSEKNYEDERSRFRKIFGKYIVDELPNSHKTLWQIKNLPEEIQIYWK